VQYLHNLMGLNTYNNIKLII